VSTVPALESKRGMRLLTATSLEASCGRETLSIRFSDGRATLAIDENDNGVIVSANGDQDLLIGLCAALTRGPVEDVNESWTSTLPSEAEAVAELTANSSGYTLTIAAISERPRRVSFSYEDGQLLRKAVRGTFGLWDL
jgi:hypothetical protein